MIIRRQQNINREGYLAETTCAVVFLFDTKKIKQFIAILKILTAKVDFVIFFNLHIFVNGK